MLNDDIDQPLVSHERHQDDGIQYKPSLPRKKTVLFLTATFATLSLIIFVLSIVGAWILPGLVQDQLRHNAIIDSKEAPAYSKWADNRNGPNIYYDIFVFNVTNPKEASQGAKPILNEIGPYSFKEYRVKYDVEFLENGEIVQYWEYRYYVFDGDRSAPGLSQNDTFITAGIPFQGINAKLQSLDPESAGFQEFLLLNEAWATDLPGYSNEAVKKTPFFEVGVSDIYFGFANESLLVLASEFAPPNTNVSTWLPGLGATNLTSVDDMYWQSNINQLYTGKSDNKKTGKFERWLNMSTVHTCRNPLPNDKNRIPICPSFQDAWNETEANAKGWFIPWKTPEAATISAYDVNQFPRNSHDNEINIFVDSIYRRGFITKDNSFSGSFQGVGGSKYVIEKSQLNNATETKENAPYYSDGPRGLLNLVGVAGFPFYVSKPHFLDGDIVLLEGVEGLNPERSIHDTVIIKNDMSGLTLTAKERLQLNAVMYDFSVGQSSDSWSGNWTTYKTPGYNHLYLPIAWGAEIYVMDQDDLDQLAQAQFLHDRVPTIILGVGIPFAVACFFASAYFYKKLV